MKPSLANLRKKAAALAERIPLGRLHPAPGNWVRGFRSRTRWGVALSGGADSVVLLLLLWAHFPHCREYLLVLHYNHRLRGSESDADEAFCYELCERLGVELAVGRRPDGVELHSEAEAREARFAFFWEEMERVGSCVFWLGHQKNDVAETLLMRLVRGSGTGGLAAPRPVQKIVKNETHCGRVHLRPLLTLSRAEIDAALCECGIPWREDATNAGGEFFRNRIRRDVLPALIAVTDSSREEEGQGEKQEERKAEGRDVLAGMALSRELIEEDDAALDAWATAVAKAVIREGAVDLRELGAVPRAVKRRVLHRWLREHAGAPTLSRQAFEVLLSAIESGKSTRQSLGKLGFALIRKRILKYETNTQ